MVDDATPNGPALVLASASPRRVELLGRLLGPGGFTVVAADVDEAPGRAEPPHELVTRLAGAKARAVAAARDGAVVVAADTVVDLDGEVLGKPLDEREAVRFLRRLAGRTHLVHTGVAVHLFRRDADGGHRRVVAWVETAEVTFGVLGTREIEAYVATGEPLDKAGAYGIQGGAGAFVTDLQGDMDTVIGLPLDRLGQELRRLGVSVERRGGPS